MTLQGHMVWLRERWWAIGLSLFVAAFALVVAVAAVSHSGGNAFEGPLPVTVAGDSFKLVRGQGRAAAGAYELDALDSSGVGVLSASVQGVVAQSYPRVECTIREATAAGVQLSLLWRTLEQPNQIFRVPLEWQFGDVVAAEPHSRDGWNGTIIGIALAVRGNLAQPLVLQSCSIPSVSGWTALMDIGRQWSKPFPFKGASIHIPFDAERSDHASVLLAVALAVALAMGGYYFLARRRRWPQDVRVYCAIFLIGWLVLDLRWQVNLWRELAQATREFAGKTSEQKHLAADDHALFELMQQVNGVLPASPVRIHLLSDSRALRTRGAFFLYPHNVYHDPNRQRRVPLPDQLHSGDYALLLAYSGLRYDREHQQLLWPDGFGKPADEILASANGFVLLRMR